MNVVERCRTVPFQYSTQHKCSQRATETIGGYPVCKKHYDEAYKHVEQRKKQGMTVMWTVHFDDGVSLVYDEFGWGIATPRADFYMTPSWEGADRQATFGGGSDYDSYSKRVHIKAHGGYDNDAVVTIFKQGKRPWLMTIDASYTVDSGDYDYCEPDELFELSVEKAETIGQLILEGTLLMREWNEQK